MTLKAAETPAQAKQGRPLTYTAEIADEVCERLANGESLRSICSDDHLPPESTVRRWAVHDEGGFAAHYAQAREIGYARLAEDILDISDNGTNDWIERNDPNNAGYEANGEHIQRSRLRVESRKWLLSKCLPKIYGDRIETHHTGEVRTRASEDDGVLARAVVRLLNMADTVDGGELESQPIDNAGKATD